MINASNILTYIKFLYQKKYEQVAPAQLLSQWRSVPEHQIQTELQKLYAHWEWSVSQGRKKEEEFIKLSAILAEAETVQQPQNIETKLSEEKPKRKGNWLRWFSPLLLLALAYGIYTNYEGDKNDIDTQEKTSGTLLQEPAQEPPLIEEPIIAMNDTIDQTEGVPNSTETTDDKLNKANIKNYIFAEDDRNLETLFGLLSPNIYKYYDLDYPTQNQLRNRYEHIWEITKDNTNYISEVKKVGERTYEVFGTYEYFGLKTEKTKMQDTHVRYEMDADNKIISVDVVK